MIFSKKAVLRIRTWKKRRFFSKLDGFLDPDLEKCRRKSLVDYMGWYGFGKMGDISMNAITPARTDPSLHFFSRNRDMYGTDTRESHEKDALDNVCLLSSPRLTQGVFQNIVPDSSLPEMFTRSQQVCFACGNYRSANNPKSNDSGPEIWQAADHPPHGTPTRTIHDQAYQSIERTGTARGTGSSAKTRDRMIRLKKTHVENERSY